MTRRPIKLVLRVVSAPEDSILAVGSLIYVETDEAVVGRGDTSDVLLPDATVSRTHARIRLLPGAIRVERLTERNALFVDEASVDAAIVVESDHAMVQIGGVVLAMQRASASANQTTRPIASIRGADDVEHRFRACWDAQTCTVQLDDRMLDLPPLAAAFFGRLLETPDVPVHQWDLLESLGPNTNLNQCASIVRRALRRRLDEGTLPLDDLVGSVRAALDAPLDETDAAEVLKKLIGNQRGYGYVARVGAMGAVVERV